MKNKCGKMWKNIIKQYVRYNSTSCKLLYSEYGDPIKVVHEVSEMLPKLQSNDILIKMLAAPVNPADINTIQGKYPSRPQLPAIPGNEGVGEVLEVGNNVKNFSPGDRVIAIGHSLGTWCTHAVFPTDGVLKVPKDLDVVQAATLTVNPCTAYRMLKDFISLKAGDTVLQNGANSACGQNVIQLCKLWGIHSVNVVRNRDNINELKAFLTGLGADLVLTEEELRCTKKGDFQSPKLALNCVGGKSALEVLRHLAPSGIMVTYGGMSREPVTVPTSALIFKDISVRGFWMTQWSKNNQSSEERGKMFGELISLYKTDKLKAPAFKMVQFDQYKEALMNTMTVKGMIGLKYILQFHDNI